MPRFAASFAVAAAATAVLAGALAAAPAPADAFRALVDREWQWRLREDPLFATAVGEHDYDDRLPSAAADDQERHDRETRQFLAELDAIPRAELAARERVDYDIFRNQLQERIDSFRFNEWWVPLNADSGFHSDFAQLPENVPLQTVADYDHYLARLTAFPRYMQEQIAALRADLQDAEAADQRAEAGERDPEILAAVEFLKTGTAPQRVASE